MMNTDRLLACINLVQLKNSWLGLEITV